MNRGLKTLTFKYSLLFFALIAGACVRKLPQKIAVEPARTSTRTDSGPQMIVIDPGHGGDDFGTKSCFRPYLYEKTLALRTAKLVYGYLNQWGYVVRLTRNSDVFIPLLKRVQLANMSNSRIFVSIHYNSAPSKEASGIEVFFYRDNQDKRRMWRSERLAKKILANMVSATHAHSRGVKAGNFAVIRETKMPSVLIEAGFLSNSEDSSRLKKPSYLEKLSYSIAKGIDDFLKG